MSLMPVLILERQSLAELCETSLVYRVLEQPELHRETLLNQSTHQTNKHNSGCWGARSLVRVLACTQLEELSSDPQNS